MWGGGGGADIHVHVHVYMVVVNGIMVAPQLKLVHAYISIMGCGFNSSISHYMAMETWFKKVVRGHHVCIGNMI